MTLRLRITHGLNEGATFELGSQFVRIGSDPGNEIRLSGTGIPKIALVLEFHAPSKSYRIHDRSHGRLILAGKPVSGGAPTAWEIERELSIDEIVTLILEDGDRTPPPPEIPQGKTSPEPKPRPIAKTAGRIRKPLPVEQEEEEEEKDDVSSKTEGPLRLKTKDSSKSKSLEIVQILCIVLVTGGICWGILYVSSPPPSVEVQNRIPYDGLADDLWAAVHQRQDPMPKKYMNVLTQGRRGEQRSPQRTLDSYVEMKQDILTAREKGGRDFNRDLENRLLEYLNQRILFLQRQLAQQKKK